MEKSENTKIKSDIIWLGCMLSRLELMDEEKEAIKHVSSVLAKILKENEHGSKLGETVCQGNCDTCELGVPIDGQFYDDGTPIHECGIKGGST